MNARTNVHTYKYMYMCKLTIDINEEKLSKLSNWSFIIECSTSYSYT